MSLHLGCDEHCHNPNCGADQWADPDIEQDDPYGESLVMYVDERIRMYVENIDADELYDPAWRELGDAA